MRKLFLILVSGICYGQFSITPEKGLITSEVIQVEGFTQAELYTQALKWVQKNYSDPKNVIKGNIQNEFIRVSGFTDKAFNFYDGEAVEFLPLFYEIEISFKDGKYKMDLARLEYDPEINGMGLKQVGTAAGDYYRNGEVIKNAKVRVNSLPAYFNSLNSSLYTFITTKTDNW